MSANNFYFITQSGKKFYGFDLMAEDWGEHDEKHPIKLKLSEADVVADSAQEVEEQLNDKGYAEYGATFAAYLPKDGTPIKVVK